MSEGVPKTEKGISEFPTLYGPSHSFIVALSSAPRISWLALASDEPQE